MPQLTFYKTKFPAKNKPFAVARKQIFSPFSPDPLVSGYRNVYDILNADFLRSRLNHLSYIKSF